MKIHIFGLAGKECVGKDTIADYIAYDYIRRINPTANVFRFQFARLLKQTLATLYQVDENVFDRRELKESKIIQVDTELFSPRELMLHYGKNINELHPNFFIHNFINKLQDQIDSSILLGEEEDIIAIISDVRFQNELDFIRSRNGYVLNVCTDNISPSELNCDFVFTNKMSGMFDLHESLDKFLDNIKFFE